MPEIIYLGQAM